MDIYISIVVVTQQKVLALLLFFWLGIDPKQDFDLTLTWTLSLSPSNTT